MTTLPDLPVVELDEFEPDFGAMEYFWGPPVQADGVHWKDHQYHAEILSWHYHDYLGTHVFMQVWDYAQQSDPNQRWQYYLVLHRPDERDWDIRPPRAGDWRWVIRKEYETPWTEGGPTHAEVGADVDLWLRSPKELRFLLEG